MKYQYTMHRVEGEIETGEVYTLDYLERIVRSWIINDSFSSLEIVKDDSESVEDVVIHYLEWLEEKMRGDLTEEELEDTDLGWEIDHVSHTIGSVIGMKKSATKSEV